jgi:glycosyltransferase involved in cell wall biosynthesis
VERKHKRIKILYTIPNFDTAGSGRVLYDLARTLSADDFDLSIACQHDRGKFFSTIQSLHLPIYLIDTTTDYRPWIGLPFRVLRISIFFRKHRFDLIHSWHWSSDWTEPLAARLAGIKWIYTKKTMSWGSIRNWTIRSRLAAFITTINPDMKDRYFKGYNNVRLLPLGLDTRHFDRQEKILKYRDWKVKKTDFVIVSVVNLVKAKGIEVLVEAIRRLNDPSIVTFIVGDFASDYGQGIYEMVSTLRLGDRILFTGKVLDVRPHIALADLFVTPTNVDWEGMPMAPVEGMASARVVIGTNTAGINYILQDFVQLLVPPNDPAALVEKIKEVKRMTQERRDQLGLELRDKVIGEFSVERFAENYGSLYKELINN